MVGVREAWVDNAGLGWAFSGVGAGLWGWELLAMLAGSSMDSRRGLRADIAAGYEILTVSNEIVQQHSLVEAEQARLESYE